MALLFPEIDIGDNKNQQFYGSPLTYLRLMIDREDLPGKIMNASMY